MFGGVGMEGGRKWWFLYRMMSRLRRNVRKRMLGLGFFGGGKRFIGVWVEREELLWLREGLRGVYGF